jgi:L-ribulose-5-phosphate 4-epimerase
MTDAMIEGDYEYETGFQIINAFKEQRLDPREIEMVLVANHAPFTWGSNVAKAVYNSVILEQLAKMAFISCILDPAVKRLKPSLIKKHYDRKHGKNAYYGQ